jgi:hypothetical protein
MGDLKSVDDQSQRKYRSVIMDGQNPLPKSAGKRSGNDVDNIGDSFFTAPVTDDKDENRESVRIGDGIFFFNRNRTPA